MVGWFGFNGPLRQYFSLYRAGEVMKIEVKRSHEVRSHEIKSRKS